MTSTQHNRSRGPGIPGAGGRRESRDPGTPVVIDSGPGGLIAAVPGLLGFTPTASIVLIGLTYHQERLESVGPVVRTDLVPEAAAAGADALCGAVYDMPGAKAAVVLVAPGVWPFDGLTSDVLGAALCELYDNAVDVSGVYVTETLHDGGVWCHVHQEGLDDGWRIHCRGSIDDPQVSPILSSGDTTVHNSGATSESMDRELDPVDDEVVRSLLPASWTTGVATPGHGRTWSPEDVCRLVAGIRGEVESRRPGDTSMLLSARREVRRALAVPGTAEQLFTFCTRVSLFPSLVALAAGGSATVVMALLLETAALGRRSLRSRALLLISVLGWCGNHGALGHRAVRRCLQEMDEGRGAGMLPEVIDNTEQLGDELLTMSLAGVIWDGVSDGSAARAVRSILDQGITQLDDEKKRDPAGTDSGYARLLGSILDRQALTVVRNALGRRAGK
ncbi:DUF4192 family protein [Corynebacterium glyciniphilum]|uniref:DUF4192 family protein n=1 Tax=Corynebacterium glyciniphilum TaxID=1404244 RepID=UPI002650334D|nr:DUF4192 family protein [Corynebacterium glyciniphilum]MDN5682876.1 DUF4192 domain-containing protein [Corynebacterium glyciniphilum]MDN6705640.1 DUF4192 domain-containing protein [Corynebacterium glyciniphilum]